MVFLASKEKLEVINLVGGTLVTGWREDDVTERLMSLLKTLFNPLFFLAVDSCFSVFQVLYTVILSVESDFLPCFYLFGSWFYFLDKIHS